MRLAQEEALIIEMVQDLSFEFVKVLFRCEEYELHARYFLNSMRNLSEYGARIKRDHDFLPAWMTGLMAEKTPSDQQYGGWIVAKFGIVILAHSLNRGFGPWGDGKIGAKDFGFRHGADFVSAVRWPGFSLRSSRMTFTCADLLPDYGVNDLTASSVDADLRFVAE